MKEHEIQDVLYSDFCGDKNHIMTVPNCKAMTPRGESDLLSVTKALFVHEFEIKRSTTDFLREFETKSRKHRILENKERDGIPNYFWFVAPEGVVEDIPEYSGHIRVDENELEVMKDAPRLHNDKMSDRARRYLERGLQARLWQRRSDT